MSVNTTAPIARPPVENSTRRGTSALTPTQSPFSSLMAQESQNRAAALQAGGGGLPAAPGMNGGQPALPIPGGTPGALASLATQGTGAAAGAGERMTPEQARIHMARSNNLAQVNLDRQRNQALDNLSQAMSGGDSPLDMARNAVTMRNMRTVVGGFNLRSPAMPMADSIKAQALQGAHRASRAQKNAGKTFPAPSGGVGKLAAQFESGSDGIAAIGYDRTGGTSYGKYQIASRVGTMDRFLNFLDTAAPEMSKQLREAGPANTGNRQGAMPDVWRKLAAEQPERFEALQEKFIHDSHYKPALEAVVQRTSLGEKQLSPAMQEVLWSTAVQHGPAGATRIFTQATENAGKITDKNYDQNLIGKIYAIRAEQFGSSTAQVQQAVRNRMHKEKDLALNMLGSKGKMA